MSHWREKIAADFGERLKWLTAELRALTPTAAPRDDLARVLRRLAAMRIPFERQHALARVGRLANAAGPALPGFRPFRLLAAGNRTLDFLAADLAAAAPARGLLIDMVVAGYDAVAALALDPSRALPAGGFNAGLLLLDADAFAGESLLLDRAREETCLAEAQAHLGRLADGLAARLNRPLIVATLPTRPIDQFSSSDGGLPGARARFIARLNAHIHDGGAGRRWIVWDLAALAARLGAAIFFDPLRLHLAKTPFALEAGPAVADNLAALVAAMTGKSSRALVLDLDNTLWGGVVADEGVAAIRIGQGDAESEAFLAFQAHVLEWRRRGVALAVCSKNREAIARESFAQRPEMLLRLDHFAAFVANFDDKATNVARIAQALDLGVESLVFVDDNPAERERVRAELPFVAVPEMPEDPSRFPLVLAEAGYFEHLPPTGEDLKRGDAYAGRARAIEARAEIGNYESYLASLDMHMIARPFDAMAGARIAQLINKSNQFNLTTKRYGLNEVAALEADRTRLTLQARLADRFAEHGMIAVVIVDRSDAAIWLVDTWLMSCRVLQRGVEQALMNMVFAAARETGARLIRGVYRPTPRNGLVADFYARMGFRRDAAADADGGEEWQLPVAEFTPFQTHIALD